MTIFQEAMVNPHDKGVSTPADENDGRPIAYRPWPIACFHGNQKQNMFSKIRFF